MKANYLFPAVFRKIGWTLLGISIGLSFFIKDSVLDYPSMVFALWSDQGWFKIIHSDGWSDEANFISVILAFLFISFSKEKQEDECIAEIRSRSLVWAMLVNYSLLILATVLVYGSVYLDVIYYSFFSVFILFILKYNLALYKLRRSDCE